MAPEGSDVGPLQLLLPIAIRFDLVNEDSASLTSVPGEVTLSVSLQIQPADPIAAMHPDPGVHSATLPLNVARIPKFTDSSRACRFCFCQGLEALPEPLAAAASPLPRCSLMLVCGGRAPRRR